MLKVKTYIDKSTIENAGLGCFAAKNIKKGDLIWELNTFFDGVYSEQSFNIMSDIEIEFVKTYSFMENGLYFLCVDNARFFNHSVENCNTLDPCNTYKTFALCDINIGDEILSNYSTFGSTELDKKFNMDI